MYQEQYPAGTRASLLVSRERLKQVHHACLAPNKVLIRHLSYYLVTLTYITAQ
jgi:hypothetical protein